LRVGNIEKEGKPADSLFAYRPIDLLNDIGKLFERIIVTRVVQNFKSFREGSGTRVHCRFSIPWEMVERAADGLPDLKKSFRIIFGTKE